MSGAVADVLRLDDALELVSESVHFGLESAVKGWNLRNSVVNAAEEYKAARNSVLNPQQRTAEFIANTTLGASSTGIGAANHLSTAAALLTGAGLGASLAVAAPFFAVGVGLYKVFSNVAKKGKAVLKTNPSVLLNLRVEKLEQLLADGGSYKDEKLQILRNQILALDQFLLDGQSADDYKSSTIFERVTSIQDSAKRSERVFGKGHAGSAVVNLSLDSAKKLVHVMVSKQVAKIAKLEGSNSHQKIKLVGHTMAGVAALTAVAPPVAIAAGVRKISKFFHKRKDKKANKETLAELRVELSTSDPKIMSYLKDIKERQMRLSAANKSEKKQLKVEIKALQGNIDQRLGEVAAQKNIKFENDVDVTSILKPSGRKYVRDNYLKDKLAADQALLDSLPRPGAEKSDIVDPKPKPPDTPPPMPPSYPPPPDSEKVASRGIVVPPPGEQPKVVAISDSASALQMGIPGSDAIAENASSKVNSRFLGEEPAIVTPPSAKPSPPTSTPFAQKITENQNDNSETQNDGPTVV